MLQLRQISQVISGEIRGALQKIISQRTDTISRINHEVTIPMIKRNKHIFSTIALVRNNFDGDQYHKGEGHLRNGDDKDYDCNSGGTYVSNLSAKNV